MMSGVSVSNQWLAVQGKQVILRNAETDEIVEVLLNPEDAVRAQTDGKFAQELLRVALQSKEKDDPAVEPPAASENMEDEPCSEGLFYRWPEAGVLLLLETFKAKEKQLFSGKVSHRKFWDEVALVLQLKGHQVTGPQCSSKLRSLKRTYKAVKVQNNQKSGYNQRTWQYFELVDEIFGRKAGCRPVAVASSSGISVKEAKGSSEKRQPKKSATASFYEMRVAEKAEREAERAKRHHERLEHEQKRLATLSKMNAEQEAARERRHRETMALGGKLLAAFSQMNAEQAKRHKETMELGERLLSTFSTS